MNETMPAKIIAWISPRKEEPRRFWTSGVIGQDCVRANYIIETEHEELVEKEYARGYSDAEIEINKTALGEKVEFLSKQNTEQRDLVERQSIEIVRLQDELFKANRKLSSCKNVLFDIAKPKVGPDFDWTQEEVDKWRAVWYNKYENMAREVLKDD